MSAPPRPLILPRFAIPISLIVAMLAVVAFAAVACRGDTGAGSGEARPDLTATLGVVAPVAKGAAAPGQEKTPAEDEDELEEFVPTEEVSADKSVSFPVDI
jgi:hypothetical protein